MIHSTASAAWPALRSARASAGGGREIQWCLWAVARPVTCAPQPHRSPSSRQLTGLAATAHRPDARAQAPSKRIYFLDPEYEYKSRSGASARALALSDLWTGRPGNDGSRGALSIRCDSESRVLQNLVAAARWL